MAKGNGSTGCGCLMIILLLVAILSPRNGEQRANNAVLPAPQVRDTVEQNPTPRKPQFTPQPEQEHAPIVGEKDDSELRARAAQEKLDQEMAEYEVAKAEYHAAEKLRLARQLRFLSLKAASEGKTQEKARLDRSIDAWYRSIIRFYPETAAADDAEQLLLGEEVAERPMPSLPKLPSGIDAQTADLADKAVREAATQTNGKSMSPGGDIRRQREWRDDESSVGGVYRGPAGIHSSSGIKTVHVRSYTRKDGTFVRSHMRSAPGGGGGRRR